MAACLDLLLPYGARGVEEPLLVGAASSMFIFIGWAVVLGSIFGGFVMAGGHLAALWQPLEVLMIFGGAFGAFLAANGGKPLKKVLGTIPSVFKGPTVTKDLFMELFAMLFEILTKARKEGLMSVEADIEDPHASAIFSKYPKVLADHHVMDFICDYLRMMVSGNLNAFEMENLMDVEMEAHHNEGHAPIGAVQGLADGMPAFGIVAAVMGVVHTMESLHLPPNELGILIAHALVGTFLGILLSYGFVAPIAGALTYRLEDEAAVYKCIKMTLLASVGGAAPQAAVEFGRKALFSVDRPSFAELEEHCKQAKSK